MKNLRENMPEAVKEKVCESEKKRKQNVRQKSNEKVANIFSQVQDQSKVDHSILKTEAYKIIKSKFQKSVSEGPTYICDICWKYEFRSNVVKLVPNKYKEEI